jgi:hypothetical protein
MKKILFALFAIAFFAVSANAQATKSQKKRKFYYYPSSDVYFDVSTNEYAYDSSGTWVYVQTLPETIVLGDNPGKVVVYHDTPDVWADNKIHKVKYKNGVLKKDKPKPNKSTTQQ